MTTKKWAPLVAVCLGTFMLLVDVTIVNVALPDMARDLATSFADLQWVIDLYALVLAALLLGAGSLADGLGHRRIFLVGTAVFGVGSLGSGLAPTAAVLIGARGVQGLGAAAMFATTGALIFQNYQGRDRGVAFGVFGATAGAAAAIGPVLGGLLTEGLTWRWIFFVNVPVCIAALAIGGRVLPAGRPGKLRLDPGGVVTFSASAATLTYGLIRASQVGWGAASTLVLFGVAAVSLVAFVAVERRCAQPMVDLALLRRPAFLGVLIGGFTFQLAAFPVLAYVSLWLQSVLGYGAIEGGAVLVPLSIMSFFVAIGVGRLGHGVAPRWLIGFGTILCGIGAFAQLGLGAGSTWTHLTIGLVVTGFGVGLNSPTLASAAVDAVPPMRAGMASGAMNTARQLGYALGIAAAGTVLTDRVTTVVGSHDVAKALAGGQAQALVGRAAPAQRAAVEHLARHGFTAGLDAVFVLTGIVGVVGGILVLALMRSPSSHPDRDATPTPPGPTGQADRASTARG